MATNVGDLYVNLKLDIKNLEKGLKKAERELKKTSKNTKQTAKEFQLLNNNMVRSIRRMETFAVAAISVYHAMDSIFLAGVKLNQQYEDQALGIAALVTAKTKLIGVNKQEVQGYEKFLYIQGQTAGVMDDIKKAALDTPASFQQMVGFYQQTIGHALSANGTFGESIEDVNKNVIQFTKGMSAMGSAMGMEMSKVNEEIRSIMSGNASTDSLLALVLFGSPTEANKAVKDAKTRTTGLSELLLSKLEPFKNLESVTTYTKAMAQMGAAADEIRKDAMKPLFDDMKAGAIWIREYLTTNSGQFVKDWQDSYDTIRGVVSVLSDGLVDIYGSLTDMFEVVGNIFDGFEGWLDILAIVKVAMSGIGMIIQGINIGFIKSHKLWLEIKNATNLSTMGELSAEDQKRLNHYEQNRHLKRGGEASYNNFMNEMREKYSVEKQFKSDMAKLDAAEAAATLKIHDLDEVTLKNTKEKYKVSKEYHSILRMLTGAKTEDQLLEKANAAYALTTDPKTIKALNERVAAKYDLLQINKKIAEQTQTGNATGEDGGGTGKVVKQLIALTTEEANLLVEKARLFAAQNGLLLTQRELNAQNLTLAQAEVAAMEDAYNFAKSKYGGSEDPRAKKKLIELEIKLTKAKAKEAKVMNKQMIDTAKKLKGVGDNLFDDLLSGDFKTALSNMAKGVLDVFLNPIKDQFTTFFGNTFSGLISTATDTVLDSLTVVSAKSIATSQAEGAAAVAPAISKSGSIGGLPMAIAMAAMLAAVGLSAGTNGTDSYTPTAAQFLNGGTGSLSDDQNNSVNLTSDGVAMTLKDYNAIIELARVNQMSFNRTLEAYVDLQEEAHEIWTNATQSLRKFSIELKNYQSAVDATYAVGNFSALNEFFDNFYSESEKLAAATRETTYLYNILGSELPASSAAARAEVEKWLELYRLTGDVAYLKNANEFAEAANSYQDMKDAAEAMRDAAEALRDIYYESYMTAVGTYYDQVASINAYNGVGESKSALQSEVDRNNKLFDIIREETGRFADWTVENFFDKYSSLIDKHGFSGLSEDTANDLAAMGDAVNAVRDSMIEYNEVLLDLKNQELAFYEDILNRIQDAYLGSLSYLTTIQKAEYAANLAETQQAAGDISYLDTMAKQLEYEMATSTTREEYMAKFNDYIRDLQAQEYEEEATTDDVVDQLQEINDQIAALSDAITTASYT